MRASWISCLGIAVACGACDNGASPTTAGGGPAGDRAATSLVVVRPADVTELDPARTVDAASLEVIEQVYEGLVRWDDVRGQIVPALAVAWWIEDGGRAWQFRLRLGVRFHDGSVLDAAAVVASFERQHVALHPAHVGEFASWARQLARIEHVAVVDPATVRITLTEPYAPLLETLTAPAAAIVSGRALAINPTGLSQQPVGTGPFRFRRWERGERLVLQGNLDYWDPTHRPTLRRLTFEVQPDARQRLIALENGTADLAAAILPDEQQYVMLHPALALHTAATSTVAYLAMNLDRPPLDDVRVRRAIAMAINTDAIVQLTFQGLGVPATGPLAPGQWAYHPPNAPPRFDPAQAEALLREVSGDAREPLRPLRLFAPSTPRPYLLDPGVVARAIIGNLADVGITVELVAAPDAEHAHALEAGEHDLALTGWIADTVDPDALLTALFDGGKAEPGTATNITFVRDDGVHALLAAARREPGMAARAMLYAELQERLLVDAPWVPLAHIAAVYAARADLGPVPLGPGGHPRYATLHPGAR